MKVFHKFLAQLLVFAMVLNGCSGNSPTPVRASMAAQDAVDANTKQAFQQVSTFYIMPRQGEDLRLASDDTETILMIVGAVAGVAVVGAAAKYASSRIEAKRAGDGPDAGLRPIGVDDYVSGAPYKNLSPSSSVIEGKVTPEVSFNPRATIYDNEFVRNDGTVIQTKGIAGRQEVSVQGEDTVVGLVSPAGTVPNGIFITKAGESVVVHSKLRTPDGFELSVVRKDPLSTSLGGDHSKVELDQKAFKPTLDGFPAGSELAMRASFVSKFSESNDFKLEANASGSVGGLAYIVGSKPIGKGSYGEVFEVKIATPDGPTTLAVKKINKDSINAETINEMKMLDALNGQKGFVPYYGAFRDADGNLLIAMNKMDGGLDTQFSASMFTQVSDALVILKSKGIVHNDIKPDNFLMKDGEVHMADLGSATTPKDAIINRGQTAYTPVYVAPERLHLKYRVFEPHQGDVYSAGLSLINRKHPDLFAEIENNFYLKNGDNVKAFTDGSFARELKSQLTKKGLDRYDQLLVRMIETEPTVRIDAGSLRAELTKLEGAPAPVGP